MDAGGSLDENSEISDGWYETVGAYADVDRRYLKALQECSHTDVVAAVNAAKLRRREIAGG